MEKAIKSRIINKLHMVYLDVSVYDLSNHKKQEIADSLQVLMTKIDRIL